MNRKAISKILIAGFYICLIAFFGIYLVNLDYQKLNEATLYWPYVAVATLLGITFRYIGAIIWMNFLSRLGAADVHKHTRELFNVYGKSWMARYIPGTAPWIVSKIYFASKLGISKNKLAVGSILEAGTQIIVTLVMAFILLSLDPRLDVLATEFKIIMIVIAVGGILILLPPTFNRLIGTMYKLVKRKTFSREHWADWRMLTQGTLLLAANALIGGVSFFFFAKAINLDIDFTDILFVIGASNLASSVGMLAIFAPSGLGVREAVQLLLLSIIMDTEIALVVVVATRIWATATDVLFYFVTRSPSKPVFKT